jgi:hypothetical protein
MGTPIGFNAEINTTGNDQEISSIEALKKMISTEIRSSKDFENTLLRELKEVKDLELNMKVIEHQMENLEKLANARKDIIMKVLVEKNRTPQNTGLLKRYIEMIDHIDIEMNPMSEKLYSEISRFIVPEIHHIASESDKNKTFVMGLDQKARNMSVKVYAIHQEHITFNKDIAEARNSIKIIEDERNNRPINNRPTGFVQEGK